GVRGLPALPDAQGVRVRGALDGGTVPVRPVFFQWIGAGNRGARWGPWKLVQTGAKSVLFDLRSDGGERMPVSGSPMTEVGTRLVLAYLEEAEGRRRALDAATERMPVSS